MMRACCFGEAGLNLSRAERRYLVCRGFCLHGGTAGRILVAANYARDAARKDRGFTACNWLALNRTIPAGSRDLARGNLFFYVQSASEMMPSFATHPLQFAPPDAYRLSSFIRRTTWRAYRAGAADRQLFTNAGR